MGALSAKRKHLWDTRNYGRLGGKNDGLFGIIWDRFVDVQWRHATYQLSRLSPPSETEGPKGRGMRTDMKHVFLLCENHGRCSRISNELTWPVASHDLNELAWLTTDPCGEFHVGMCSQVQLCITHSEIETSHKSGIAPTQTCCPQCLLR